MEGIYIFTGLIIDIAAAFIFLLEKRWKRMVEEVKKDPSAQTMWLSMQNQIEQLTLSMPIFR